MTTMTVTEIVRHGRAPRVRVLPTDPSLDRIARLISREEWRACLAPDPRAWEGDCGDPAALALLVEANHDYPSADALGTYNEECL